MVKTARLQIFLRKSSINILPCDSTRLAPGTFLLAARQVARGTPAKGSPVLYSAKAEGRWGEKRSGPWQVGREQMRARAGAWGEPWA